jgi:diphthamide synthase subunit DPH2
MESQEIKCKERLGYCVVNISSFSNSYFQIVALQLPEGLMLFACVISDILEV